MIDPNIAALREKVTPITDKESDGSERDALIKVSPAGFHLRPPPAPHKLIDDITPDTCLFQTIHMGPALVDLDAYRLVIDGLVTFPLSISWSQLLALPKESITAFHECYGSPVKPPDTNLWRIGNVIWSGVPLKLLLDMTQPKPDARYVWSDGLEKGSFFKAQDVKYQKDVTLDKAQGGGCLVAYEMNGERLTVERGGPVRLIVPGWYGTNSTKWLCRLSLQDIRAKGPFTTTYYNEIHPQDNKSMRPCWDVEPNSFLLTTPASEGEVNGPGVVVAGRAWAALGIEKVSICVMANGDWQELTTLQLPKRFQFEWQHFSTIVDLAAGDYTIMVRATDIAGTVQPIQGRRNHVHTIDIKVI